MAVLACGVTAEVLHQLAAVSRVLVSATMVAASAAMTQANSTVADQELLPAPWDR
jgi:hypothetical protein